MADRRMQLILEWPTALKAFLRIADAWRLDELDVATLLDLPASQLRTIRVWGVGRHADRGVIHPHLRDRRHLRSAPDGVHGRHGGALADAAQ
jgi:hypothetical protein